MQSAGGFTALDFTLRRISTIEQGFNRLFVEPNSNVTKASNSQTVEPSKTQEAKDFQEVLDNAIATSSVSSPKIETNTKPTKAEPQEIEGLIEKYSTAKMSDTDIRAWSDKFNVST